MTQTIDRTDRTSNSDAHRGGTARPGSGRLPAALLLVALAVLVLAGCAPEANPQAGVPAPDGELAGFWLGLWQGIIAPVTFVISLFSDSVGIYEVHNNGGWYDFGYVLGLGMIVGGGSAASAR